MTGKTAHDINTPKPKNPTDAELKDSLEDADLPVGEDIKYRLGKQPSSEEE